MIDKPHASTLLRAKASTAKGAAVANARVYCTQAPVDIPDIAALTNEDGEVLLAAPAPGHYSFEFNADGYRKGTIEVDIVQQKEVAVSIVLVEEQEHE